MSDISNLSPSEWSFYEACREKCKELYSKSKDRSLESIVDEIVNQIGDFVEDQHNLKEYVLESVTAYCDPVNPILSDDVRKSTWWTTLKSEHPAKLQYWNRFHSWISKKPSWNPIDIAHIDHSTDILMNAIAQPGMGACDRRGLVYGLVQSGKTAHYISVVNKSLDAGYKFIIVLTGLQNSLRSQTQKRFDKEVLGYYQTQEGAKPAGESEGTIIGVGLERIIQGAPDDVLAWSLTNRDEKGDVNKQKAGTSYPPPMVIITKKNSPVLGHILTMFRQSPFAKNKKMGAEYPALIIDDEADQASANTKKLSDSPTYEYGKDGNVKKVSNASSINMRIRDLLTVFECSTYIGYTATPFANIFIPDDNEDQIIGKDLFPCDFIFKAPRSDSYIGAKEFFGLGDDESIPKMPLWRKIEEGKNYLKSKDKSEVYEKQIPEELKKAMKCFLISVAVRNCRGQFGSPNTMLIHIDRLNFTQAELKRKVSSYYYDNIRALINYGDQEIYDELEDLYTTDYQPTTKEMKRKFMRFMDGCDEFDWDVVLKEIKRIVRDEEISLYMINGKSDDSLQYDVNEGKPYNVIAIGGDKLSRGLTLEGLTISYFVRDARTYDTLMQMGRWFGYRPGYIDLCRLFTTEELYADFSKVSDASENLADQFDTMNSLDRNPQNFGLYVKNNPDLMITSRNKMKTGHVINNDFSCKLHQTRVFNIDPYQYDRNFKAVEQLLLSVADKRINKEEYKQKFDRDASGDHYYWTDVTNEPIIEFLKHYETSKGASRVSSKYMAEYVEEMNKVGAINCWTIVLMNVKNGESFNIADIKNVGGGISRSEGSVDVHGDTISIKAMLSKDHDYLDFKKSEKDAVDEKLAEWKKSKISEKSKSEKIRALFRKDKALLLIYPIADAGELTLRRGNHKPPIGIGVVFPNRNGRGKLRDVTINEIAYREEDEEELYD